MDEASDASNDQHHEQAEMINLQADFNRKSSRPGADVDPIDRWDLNRFGLTEENEKYQTQRERSNNSGN